MLRELRIENLLLIERAELRLEPGLNAITGETGAGKTVLAHSLDLLLGGRPKSGIVRPGAAEAWVEGAFDLDPALRREPALAELLERVPQDQDQVVLARRVSAAGRSSAFIAGRSAAAADLRLLGIRLLAFYGQHEHRKLTLASAQAEILDAFIGPEHLRLRSEYRDAHQLVNALRRELAALREREGARDRDLDLLRYELDEIDEITPDPAEQAALVTERDRLRGVEGLREGVAAAALALAGAEDGAGASGLLAEAEAALDRPAAVDPALESLRTRLAAVGLELSDLSSELRTQLDSLQADPERLEQVESRLAAVDRLLRKHGGNVESVLAHAERCRAEIERLEGAGERAEDLERRLAAAELSRAELGRQLSHSRAEAAPEFERKVVAELAELAMDGARLEVALNEHPDGYGPGGCESVELVVATNPGMPPAPLGETASGGELSRVMLALSGLGRAERVETMVFDEIDAGIGGKVARSVGERLRDLGERRQVICITHLPQVAALASAHFRVNKRSASGSTTAVVTKVGGEELVAEIVRMLGADGGDQAADRHARELLAA
jgi:DNA repair protein RecN (Recombination protein N)